MSRDAAARAYKTLHWGLPSTKKFEIDDPALPDPAVSLGYLGEVIFTVTGTEKALQCPYDESDPDDPDRCHLIVGPKAPHRLYAGLSPAMRTWCRGLWSRLKGPAWDLESLAYEVGGQQNKLGYADVRVKPLGECVSVFYMTNKKGDGPSTYEHEFGDPSPGINPWLAVSSDGRLWFVGGDYYVASHGIID